MQLGLTWPLQRLLRTSVPYGDPLSRGYCWDAHCITLHGRSSLLLVHCQSRYTCVRFDLSPLDWSLLEEIAAEEIRLGLQEAGIEQSTVTEYFAQSAEIKLTRTHGRREVAFLNRAWEDVLAADLLIDQDCHHQPLLNHTVNNQLCRCAGEDGLMAAYDHLAHYFAKQENKR